MSVPYHAWTHRPKAAGGTDPIETSTFLPTCWAQGSDFTLEDTTVYTMGITVTSEWTGEVGSQGIIDTFTFYNDPGDGTECFISDEERLMAVRGGNGTDVGSIISFSVGLLFDASFDGTITMEMRAQGTGASESLSPDFTRSVTSAEPSPLFVTYSGLTKIVPSPYDADTFNSLNIIGILLEHDAGVSLDISESWMFITRLTHLATEVTFP